MRNGAPGPRCSRPDCERRAEAKGLCHTHYKAAREARITETCKVVGCDSPVKVILWRLCSTHYQRWRKIVVAQPLGLRSTSPRTFGGLGVIACRVCGGPVVEHEIGPCPALDWSDRRARGVIGVREVSV